MIVQLAPRKVALFSRNGTKILGTHRTKQAAKAQEIAIQPAKARRAGKK